jgi:hypothetical protein
MADAVPSSNPVPIDPPTATIVISPAVNWWRRPDSLFEERLVFAGPAFSDMGSSSYIRRQAFADRKTPGEFESG